MKELPKSNAVDEPRHPERPPKDWASLVEEQIRLAHERGAFDNLPGKGKPLRLERNPFLGEDMELAFKVLQDAGFAPEWIELDKSIRSRLDDARARLLRSLLMRQSGLADLAGQDSQRAQRERDLLWERWQQAVRLFEEDVVSINRDIRDLNLKIPVVHLQRLKVDVARELERLEREASRQHGG